MKPLKIIFATGGTGGHITPAIALAEYLLTQNNHHTLIFYVDDRFANFSFSIPHSIRIYTLMKPCAPGFLKRLCRKINILRGVYRAFKGILCDKPDIIIGFGGYPSFPTLLAAFIFRIPFLLQEQNAVMGKVNRWFLPFSFGLASTFLLNNKKNTRKITVTGSLVRHSIKSLRHSPYMSPTKYLHLFVTGGSLGAGIFATLIPKALEILPSSLRKKIRLTHQVPAHRKTEIDIHYHNLGMNVVTAPFFHNMDDILATSSVIIGRAGASTLAEITYVGRPAFFIPYPNALENHQEKNAAYLSNAGGGWYCTEKACTPEIIADFLKKWIENPDILEQAAMASRNLSKENVEEEVTKLIYAVCMPRAS